jgi:thymidylate synthase
MKQTKNIISDWLEKHSDPEIDKLVEQQVREIMAETNIEYQYLDLLQDILNNGVEKKDRTGTGTISVFGRQIRHKMSEGFPLLTTKKMAFKTMVTELLWFLKGATNIKYLLENGCHIWTGDAKKKYDEDFKKYWGEKEGRASKFQPISTKEFEKRILSNDEFAEQYGELGPIYGKQWREWETFEQVIDHNETVYIDQIANLIRNLKTNPDSRRLMVNAWNVGELDQMVLPPCHYGFQVYTRPTTREEKIVNPGKYRAISLMWNQRSVDTFLGLPFNIASYGLLLEIIAKEVNMVPDELIGNLGDVHLYSNHIEQAKEQLTREPYQLPKLIINNEFWNPDDSMLSVEQVKHMEIDDFILDDYKSHPTIKAPLSN